MVSICSFATIGLEGLNEMNTLEDPFCKNWEKLQEILCDESVNSGWTTLVALIIADMPLELDFVSLASESRTDLWVEKLMCYAAICCVLKAHQGNMQMQHHATSNPAQLDANMCRLICLMLVLVWTFAKQQCNISGKFCVLQPLLLRRESCWIRIMTRNMKIVLLKTCIRHTGTYITFSSHKRSGGDSAICNYFQYLYCNITFVCRRPHNSFMQVGTSMSNFINPHAISIRMRITQIIEQKRHQSCQSRPWVEAPVAWARWMSCLRAAVWFLRPMHVCISAEDMWGTRKARTAVLKRREFQNRFHQMTDFNLSFNFVWTCFWLKALGTLGIDLLIMTCDEARRRKHLKVSPSLTSFTQYV